MKKLSKRMLSLVLSVLMVVTMLPTFAFTASAATSTKTLFHYTFDNSPAADNGDNFDENGAYSIDIDNSNGASGYWDYFDTDHYYFSKTWAKGAVDGDIRNSNYNKNWKITLDFTLYSTDSDYGASNWNHTLGLYNDAAGSPNGNPIGLQLDGQVKNGDSKLIDGSVYTFATGKRYKVTYTYHNGIFNIFVENVTDSVSSAKVFSYNCINTDYQTILENVQGVSIGGWWHNYSSMDVHDLIAYSYQNNDDVDTHLKAQYFTTKNMTKNRAGSGDLTKQGTGTEWSNTNGVTFPSGSNNHQNYFYTRTNSLLSNADEVTGFTFTFQAKNTEYQWIERFFDLTDSASWAGASANGRSISLAPNLNADLVSFKYYYSDGSGGYTDSGWTDNNPSETIANFHQYAVVVQDGAIIVYVDGTAAIKCDKTIDADLINNLISNAKLYIGASMFSSDPDFIGSIKDFRIYDIALTSSQLTGLYADSLEHCEAIFEKRIANMAANGYASMYTNIAPAYECYKASKAGEGNLAGFQEALDNMQPFDEFSAANPDTIGGNLTKDSDYYNSVIYSEGMRSNHTHGFSDSSKAIIYGSTNGGWKYGAHTYLYYPNTVLLYDGINTPKAPVTVGFINTDSRFKVWIDSLVENQTEFSLNTNWQGYNDSTTFQWPSANNNTIGTNTSYKSGNPNNSNISTIDNGESNPTTTYRMHKNAIKFTPASTPTEAYHCYSSTSWDIRANYTWGLDSDNEIDVTLTNNDADIVVINYKMLTDKLKGVANDHDNKIYLSNLATAYKNGGLEEIFAAMDSATSLNPNTGSTYFEHTYDYAGTGVNAGEEEPMDVAALLCGDDIDSSVNLLDTFEVSANTVYYYQLKKEIADYENMMKNLTGVKTNLETAYKAYLVAVEYIDAYEFGGKRDFSNPTLEGAFNNLESAVNAIGTWTAPTTLSSGIAFEDGDISSNYYQNVLQWGWSTSYGYMNASDQVTYPSGFPVTIETERDGQTYSQAAVSYPEAVLLYDGQVGHTPKIPIMGATVRRRQGNSRKLFYLYPTTSTSSTNGNEYFALDTIWHGEKQSDVGNKTQLPMNWNAMYAGSAQSNKTNVNLGNVTYVEGFHTTSWGTNYDYGARASNTMSYIGSGNTTNYYESLYLPWVTQLGSAYNNNDNHYGTSSVPIHVINYAPILNKINTASTAFSNGIDVSNYREGGLKKWFNQIDELTSLNINSYEYTGEDYDRDKDGTVDFTGIKGAVVHCADDIKSVVADTSDMSSTEPTSNKDTVISDPYTRDASGKITGYKDYDDSSNKPYDKLKIAINEARSAPATQGCVNTSVWENYAGEGGVSGGARNAALDAAANIASDNASEYTDKNGYSVKVSTIADNLHNAILALSNYINSTHVMEYSYRETDEHTIYFQCHSNNAHELDAEHHTVLAADSENYDTLGVIYDSLDLDKYTAAGKTAIAAGKATYDSLITGDSGYQIAPNTTDLQSYVDARTAALISAINTANAETADFNNINVTFNVYTVNGKGVASASPAYTDTRSNQRYGSTLEFTPKDDAVYSALAGTGITADNMGIVKWELVAGGKTRTFTKKFDTYNTFVQEDATVNVYVTKVVPQSQLVVNNLSGDNQYVLDVNDDTTVSISSSSVGTITVDGDTYNVPNTLSYVVGGWKIGNNVIADTTTSLNTTIGALKSEYGVASVTLNPVKDNNSNIDGATYNFTLDGEPVLSDVAYDTKITVSTDNENAYAIVIKDDDGKYIPVVYGNSYTFQAVHDYDFYTLCYTAEDGYYVDINGNGENTDAINDFQTKIFYNNKVPFAYSFNRIMGNDMGTDSEGNKYSNKWTTFSAFSKGGNATITECGTLRTTETVTQDDFVLENVGSMSIVKMANTKRLEYSNQYSYSLSTTNTSPRMVVTRSYVKYRYTYNGSEIDAVAYGPLLVSYYGNPV